MEAAAPLGLLPEVEALFKPPGAVRQKDHADGLFEFINIIINGSLLCFLSRDCTGSRGRPTLIQRLDLPSGDPSRMTRQEYLIDRVKQWRDPGQ